LVSVTRSARFLTDGTLLMQARTTVPFTSISQAPQLPLRQAVGITCWARRAASSQGSPAIARLLWPSAQWIGIDGSGIALQQRFQVHMAFEGLREPIEQPIPLASMVVLKFR